MLRRTLDLHHGKHHRGYVEKLNRAIASNDDDGMPIEDIVTRTRDESDRAICYNAAQSWNHAFLWDSMSLDGGGDREIELKAAIVGSFGEMDQFRARFKKTPRSARSKAGGRGWFEMATNCVS